jgi:murein DD-endopeptidase MepM/ murein hydrolase activator NlpD
MPWRPLLTLEQSIRPLAFALALAGAGLTGLVASGAAPAAHAVTRAATTTPVARPAAGARVAPVHLRAKGHASPQHASRSHRRTARAAHRAGWVRPAHGQVTSGYGRRWGSFHPGIDIGARYGSKVHAITRGHIVSAGWIPGYGKTVRVRADGKVFYYPHLSRIRVRHGHVRTGQVLGRVGSTGFSTGPHLHVEVRIHGRPVNPRHILVRHGVHLGTRH